MDQKELFAYENRCMQEDMPHCRAACPLQVDVRAFMDRMAAGDVIGSRKILEWHMPLPGLLGRACDHPCEAACLRKDLGGALSMSRLETFCVSALGTQTKPLPMPRKSKTIAVLGDGMAGLVVAWDLARKGYPVTVFHADERVGQHMLDRLGIMDYAILQGELDAMTRWPVTFEHKALDAALVDDVRPRFDAVFVDAETAATLAPSKHTLDPVTLADVDGRTAYGGWSDSLVTRAAQGRRAAATLERFVTGVSLTASREKEGLSLTRLQTPLKGVESAPRLEVDRYDAGQARAEAERCLQCQCLACVKECAYLKHYKGYPKIYARQIYNNAAIVKGQHLANSLINGCSLCGQCEVICPEEFSMADLCLSSRREMVERGYMPPSAHEFALEDMDAANSAASSLMIGGGGSSAHLFFPGCQLAASRGEQVLEVYRHLREGLSGGVGLALRCCGVPARWAGREDLFRTATDGFRAAWEEFGRPRVIAACASCLKTMKETWPEMEVVSLWQVLDEECPEPEGEVGVTLSIHDPCAARHDNVWLASVRNLLARHGVSIVEPDLTGPVTACCGYGGLTWSAQPDVASAMAAHRAYQLPHDAVASCVMCRDRLVDEGKTCRHVLDVLFPMADEYDPTERGPGLSARRANRAVLKRRVLREIMGLDEPEPERAEPVLYVDDDVLRRLEGRHILLEDMRTVISKSRESGTGTFESKETGHLLTSWRPSRVTFWVEYTPENGDRGPGYRIHNAYSYRMAVPNTGNVGPETNPNDFGDNLAFRPADMRGSVTSNKQPGGRS